jgi:hypothetical protein
LQINSQTSLGGPGGPGGGAPGGGTFMFPSAPPGSVGPSSVPGIDAATAASQGVLGGVASSAVTIAGKTTTALQGNASALVSRLKDYQEGSFQNFAGQCERWVEDQLLGHDKVLGNPLAAQAEPDFVKTGNAAAIPAGAAVVFGGGASNKDQGHTGISLGGGMMGSVRNDGYHVEPINSFAADNKVPLLGYHFFGGAAKPQDAGQTSGGSASGAAALGGKPGSLDSFFAQASTQTGVPTAMLKALGMTESNLDPNARSGAGAAGVMQLMPGTARGLGVTNAYDPKQNIMGGSSYLASLLKQYGGDANEAIGAYNWGPGNVNRAIKQYGNDWFSHAPAETKREVTSWLQNLQSLGGLGGGRQTSNGGGGPLQIQFGPIRVDLTDALGRLLGGGHAQPQAVVQGGGYAGVQITTKAG